ncbi:SBF1 [Branchiostoma lanceolatum]|uniref:SBF1 protein n=1 Tax=Branchiostoma lanceolatum TaxID=7740 RepID=A0A8J9ZM58_BRALA|nr:SBF1 [Branchiostoma lanceolatum]
MARLADYFIVVGFDHNKERGIGTGRGKILQRFPLTDWEDVTFHQGIELFCQPGGWNLSMQRRPPAFFVATLTDMDAERHYCACLSFMEPVEVQPNQPDDQESEEEEEEEGVENGEGPKQTLMFAPKSLVLVSRLQHFETFRHCLGILYTVYIENQSVQIETLVGNILGSVHVPPPGGPQVRFSIGAGDRQALQPPLSDSLPVTGTTVAMLFRQLGIYNVICLFCAALTDHKILFHSTSYSRMSDACQALCALMFPIKYSYVYIPVLPAFLKEVLSTPTPFIIGVHASLKNEMAELLDVIIADLDGGCLTVPDCISLSLLPEPLLSRTKLALSMVLHPDLHVSDHAFPPESTAPSPLPMLDKEIRAIFLRLIAELFFGYRGCLTLIRIHPEPVITFHKGCLTFIHSEPVITFHKVSTVPLHCTYTYLHCTYTVPTLYRGCLTLIRIHPEPVITFHKATFLSQRGLIDDDFLTKVLDGMSFRPFVHERGPPYRPCDIFDELISGIHTVVRDEGVDNKRVMKNVHELARQLYLNENPSPQPYVEKIPKASEAAHSRLPQPQFPVLSEFLVQQVIEDAQAKRALTAPKMTSLRVQQPRIVPCGENRRDKYAGLNSSARRLEVMRNCINYIFDNKIQEAKKSFPAVLRGLKSKVTRLALCEELSLHMQQNRVVLENHQFDMVVRLINCALQDCSSMDEHGVAAGLLPLVCAFCRVVGWPGLTVFVSTIKPDCSSMDEHGVAAGLLPLICAFCRKLAPGVMQFAYTLVQDHPVWANLQFWEASFYTDVQQHIKELYHQPDRNGSAKVGRGAVLKYPSETTIAKVGRGVVLKYPSETTIAKVGRGVVLKYPLETTIAKVGWGVVLKYPLETTIAKVGWGAVLKYPLETTIAKVGWGVVLKYPLETTIAKVGWGAVLKYPLETTIAKVGWGAVLKYPLETTIAKVGWGVVLKYPLETTIAKVGWGAVLKYPLETTIAKVGWGVVLKYPLETTIAKVGWGVVLKYPLETTIAKVGWGAVLKYPLETTIAKVGWGVVLKYPLETTIAKVGWGVVLKYPLETTIAKVGWGVVLKYPLETTIAKVGWGAVLKYPLETTIAKVGWGVVLKYPLETTIAKVGWGAVLKYPLETTIAKVGWGAVLKYPLETTIAKVGWGAVLKYPLETTIAKDSHELEVPSSPGMRRRAEVNRSQEKSALDIAAEQLRLWPHRSKDDQQELVNNEESTVYSQAIHYANRMVFMLVPLDTSKGIRANMGNEPESGSNSNVTSSIGGSDSFDAESAQYGEEDSDMTGSVCRFITRFVDKVCTESGVTPDHIKALHAMVPGVTAMHVDSMEQVCRESKRLPPIQKPKILRPELLPGEDIVMEGLRSYLIPDGREEGTGGSMGGPALLPAEGAVFLTTYRTIFKGIPCDPLASEQIVVRSFPVASLTREKKINVQYLSHINEWLSEGLQLRACTFQLVKLAFDEEVTSEDIETFRKLINRLRFPVSVQEMFALSRHHVGPRTMIQKHKEKNATLKEIDAIPGRRSMYGTKDWRALSKTLGKGAKRAGKQIAKRTKYMLPTDSIFMAKVDGDVRKAASLDELASDDAESRPSEKLSLERLKEQPAYRDYVRLGLGSLNGSQARQKTEPFRISQANVKYSTCRSYPALIVVPQSVSDESVRKVARCYRQSRLPVVTWRHPRTRAVLMRSGGFHGKGVMGVLKSAQKSAQLVQAPQSGGSHDTSSSVEQEQYFSALVSATPASRSGTLRQLDLSPSESLTSLFTVRTSDQSDPSTPDSQRKEAANRKLAQPRQGSGKSSNSSISSIRSGFSRQWSSFRHSVHPNKGFKHWNSLRSSGRASSGSQIDTGLRLAFENGALSKDSGISNGSIQNMHGSVLYAFGEKSQMKGVKADQFPKCDFIPVDFVEVRHMKASFKKLMRACVPSAPFTDPNLGLLKAVEESEWLQQISHLLQLSGAAVDLLDMQGASVLISLEDGWDVTAQVVSLAQVLLDPFYRTVDGFRVLVEKEWLAFGHRFSHRCNHTQASQGSGFAPVFLQFLDAVHQVLHQFPLSFEFNSYYLKLLAFHSVSGRFKSLLMDSEYERLEAGLLTDKEKHKGVHGDEPTGSLKGAAKDSGKHAHSRTIWDYIGQLHSSSPLLYNVNYQPQQESPVLRPYSCISSLRIWDYFLEEDLSSGQSYDRELMAMAVQHAAEEVPEEQLSPVSNRIIVSACYDNISQHQPNSLEWLLKESRDLEQDLGHLPLKWRFLWDKLEDNSCMPRPRKPSVSTQLVRAHGISTHKRATIEVLIKGKLSTGAEKAFTHPHRFEMASFPTPTYCDFCSQMLWGIAKQGLRCADCGYSCHERCRELVPKHCRRVRALADGGVGGSMVRLDSEADVSKASSTSMVIQGPSDGTLYDQFSSASEEHSIHEGYLYKRGALLKGWKQRWFVLDSNKHQLRYYDAIHDQHCKGFIDLSEVVSVTLSTPLPGAPKKTEDRTFFDLRTVRRVYNFLSSDRQTAQEWIDKIQSCISS